MSPDKAKYVLRKWAYETQMQYRAFAVLSCFFAILVLFSFLKVDDILISVIVLIFFLALTLFCWLKSRGKWGSNYIEKMEHWLQNPDEIISYKSRCVQKSDEEHIAEISYSSDAVYKITFTFSDQTQTSMKVNLRDKRSVIPALKVVFPQLDPKSKRS